MTKRLCKDCYHYMIPGPCWLTFFSRQDATCTRTIRTKVNPYRF